MITKGLKNKQINKSFFSISLKYMKDIIDA